MRAGSSPVSRTIIKNNISMKIINCPKCNEEVELDISRAIDEEGEVFVCHHCGWSFRYAKK